MFCSITTIAVIEHFIPEKSEGHISIFGFSLRKTRWNPCVFERKEKKCLEVRNDGCDRRGGKSSNFIVKKTRISVQFQLDLDS
jgi:hypothetical protein